MTYQYSRFVAEKNWFNLYYERA